MQVEHGPLPLNSDRDLVGGVGKLPYHVVLIGQWLVIDSKNAVAQPKAATSGRSLRRHANDHRSRRVGVILPRS